jgi:acyl-CoA reductase-like NAD-dependent aldehyde dehydrogenase
MERARVLIGDEWQQGDGGEYAVVGPATEEVVGLAPEASVRQVGAAAAAARLAWPAWSRRDRKERATLLARAAEAITAHAEALFPTVVAETGCTAAVGRQMQIPVAAQRFAAVE